MSREFFSIIREIKLRDIIINYEKSNEDYVFDIKLKLFFNQLIKKDKALEEEAVKAKEDAEKAAKSAEAAKAEQEKAEAEEDKIKELKDYIESWVRDNNSLFDENNDNNQTNSETITRVIDIYNKYWNDRFDKLRKFKIIYFLYGGHIYFGGEKGKTKFFDGKPVFWAFRNGPVLGEINNESVYKYAELDGKIFLNYDDWNENFKNIFDLSIKAMKFITTPKLIEESHETNPWAEVDNKKYHAVMDNKKIINFFSNNRPFYFK